MKKFFFTLMAAMLLMGCSSNDDQQTVYYQMVPIVEVELPESFVQGETYTFNISYTQPNDCYNFAGFEYEIAADNQISLGVVNYFYENDCPEEATIKEVQLDFYVERDDFYIFRFWQGVDDEGNSLFLEVEIPVEEE